MIAQFIVIPDTKLLPPKLDFEEVDKMIPFFPNVSIFTVPMDAYKAVYFYKAGFRDQAMKLLDESSVANPHLYFPEFIKSKIYLSEKNIDSAYYYGNKAFYGWPKAFMHYSNYNDILIKLNDTTEVKRAFNIANTLIRNIDEYKNDFIRALAEIKLNSLVKYEDASFISLEKLIGNWDEIREFNEGDDIELIDPNSLYFTSNTLQTKQGSYNYQLSNDTLTFYHYKSRNSKPLSKSIIYYSSKYNTLIYYPVIDSNRKKTYKKHKD